MGKIAAYFCILVGLLALGCGGLLTGFDLGARNPSVYTFVQQHMGVDGQLGVDIEVLHNANQSVAEYMIGVRSKLELPSSSAAALGQDFSQRERLHMEDVRSLFTLERQVMFSAWIVGFFFVVVGLYLAKEARWKMLLRFTKIAVGIWAVLVIGLAAGITLDFDKAFITFHHLLFTNDLWWLSAQDLLIRLYPQRFFENITLKLGLYMLGGFVCVYAILEALGLLGNYILKSKKRA